MQKTNKEIKDYALSKIVFLWEVAARFGITDLHVREILASERDRHNGTGKYIDAFSHTMSLNRKRQQYFQKWIWEL